MLLALLQSLVLCGCADSSPERGSAGKQTIARDPVQAVLESLEREDMLGMAEHMHAVREANRADELVGRLLVLLADSDARNKALARQAFASLGSAAVGPILDRLGAANPDEKLLQLEALSALGPNAAAAAPTLSSLLEEGDPAMRAAAAGTLAQTGEPGGAALPAVRKALEDDDPMVRINAARAIWAIDRDVDAATSVLVRIVKEADLEVQREALVALGEIGPPAKAALPAIQEARAKPDLKAYATDALLIVKYGSPHPHPHPKELDE